MLRNYLRKLICQRGFDVVRYYSVARMLNQRGINLVFDVGANTGQYTTCLREHAYHGRIVFFEPSRKLMAV